ncbi:MAG: enoyl-CoA hydratase/carnithine racemase [Myxococcota bacterium]|jgi:enoyl-CoA hydratase/carnithine racemase
MAEPHKTLRLRSVDPGIVQISLATGRGNPMSAAFLDELESVLDTLEVTPPRALVIDGGDGKLFSGGFDVAELLTFPRETLRRFFQRFSEVLARLTELPTPTLAAIHSSAVAGGFILPLACDFRIVQTSDTARLGLSEVDLGLAVPAAAQVLLAARTSGPAAMRLTLFGTLITPEEALTLGYADMLAPDAQSQAMAMAQALARKPGDGARVTKLATARPLADRARQAERVSFERFFETWYSEAAQAALTALASRLTATEPTSPP